MILQLVETRREKGSEAAEVRQNDLEIGKAGRKIRLHELQKANRIFERRADRPSEIGGLDQLRTEAAAGGMNEEDGFATIEFREKRVEHRIPLMARVEILWMDNDMTPRVSPATLDDRSDRGVSVRLKNRIEIASHVTIKSNTLQISGIVTNCRRQKAEFVIGVRLEDREGGSPK